MCALYPLTPSYLSRMDNMIEARQELRDAVMLENKRIRELEAERKKEKKEELIKKKEEILKDAVNKNTEVGYTIHLVQSNTFKQNI